MLRRFARYFSIGMINTIIHWLVFITLWEQGYNQSLANLFAFSVAVSFSFFANAHWTFKAKATTLRYLRYCLFMAGVALGVGKLADYVHIHPIITLISFSVVSLALGFVYSNFIVFREKT